MKTRPWIWIVIAHVVVVFALATVVVIAKKYGSPEIPVHHER
jgi:hypothetical protein